MTDNEIIKALEQCIKANCTKCQHHTEDGCTDALMQNALDLINRLQAENERLERHTKMHDEIKAEAIKEFAERLCEDRISNDPVVIAVKTELKLM